MKRQLFLVLLVLGGLLPLVNTAAATHDPNDFFVTEATFPGVVFTSVFGVSATDVWALSASAGQPVSVYRRIAGVWTVQTGPAGVPPSNSGENLWAADSTHIWASPGSAMWFSSGGAFAAQTFPHQSGNLWGFAANDVWSANLNNQVASGGATIKHFDGSTWSICGTCTFPGVPSFSAIGGASPTNFWAMAATGFYQYTGTWGTPLPAIITEVGGVWGAASNDVWAVDNGGTGAISHWNGLAWTLVASPLTTNNALRGIFGTSASNIWSVGVQGKIIHYDGTAWAIEPTTTALTLNDVWCATASECWAVGDGIIQKLQVNPAVAAPLVPVGMVHSDLAELETQNTNCIGAWAPFSIVNDLAPLTTIGDGDLYIYSRAAGVWVFQIDDALWTPAIPALPASQAAWTSVLLPPGDYYALLLLDITGIGAIDLFDADVFTVSASPCTDNPTDLGPVLNHIQYNQAQENATQLQLNHTDNNVTHIHAEQHNQHSITNARINTTFLSLYAQINANWARTNTTCQKTIYSIEGCEGIELLLTDICGAGSNCNFTVNNTPVLQALEAEKVRLLGFDSPETWTMLLFGALMVWALHKKWFFVAGVAMIGMISVILGTAGTWDSTGWTIAILLLLVPAYWLELWMANRHQRHSDHDAAEGSA